MGVGTWVDLLSGETWNVLKIGFQLKQVRERLAKGLVDKVRTEKRNFLIWLRIRWCVHLPLIYFNPLYRCPWWSRRVFQRRM
ncbi:hypothetical protein B0H16DRAFT_1564761, partial [Mycena metata]